MTYLLDTNIIIRWLEASSRLPGYVYDLLNDPEARIVVSAVVAWEIAIKCSLGKMRSPSGLEEVLKDAEFEMLPLLFRHAEVVAKLPLHHRDPFDRMLIAQAMTEHLTLLTLDRTLAQYGPFIQVVE